VVKTPLYGGYGLIAGYGLPKPAYVAFAVLHKLGTERLALDSDSALVTRAGKKLVVAVWNYAPPEGAGAAKQVSLEFQHVKPKQVAIWRVDGTHGDMRPAYAKMGSPRYPTQAQLMELRKAAALGGPEMRKLEGGKLSLELPAQGLAVLEIE
jgi:xylan 1,4-beta-xylosidase